MNVGIIGIGTMETAMDGPGDESFDVAERTCRPALPGRCHCRYAKKDISAMANFFGSFVGIDFASSSDKAPIE